MPCSWIRLALAALAGCSSSAEPRAPIASPLLAGAPIRSVALFKNGLGYVRREARVAPGASAVELLLPVPTHGTFSIGADPALATVSSAVARAGAASGTALAASLLELLRANPGREVELTLAEGATVRGQLLSAGEPPVQRPNPYGYYSPTPADTAVVLLETAAGSVALRGDEVRRVSSSGPPLEHRKTERRALLSVQLERASPDEIPLELASLERGWSWAPSYSIQLEEGRAWVELRAAVFAETGDLEDATLQFVTGFPNLRFAHADDPLALQCDLEAFLAALGRPQDGRPATAQQAVLANVAVPDLEPVASLLEELAGQEAGDLFVVERAGVTLRRGERGLYTLFRCEVPCQHVYRWTIEDRAEEQPDWWHRQHGWEKLPPQEEIWHSVRLQNDSAQPWTTAPAATTEKGFLLGQDILHYTAAGARATVLITRAVDVQAERS
jgi:hypothetical protein